jgi:F-type H+-transporting ATPase subunit b
MNIEPIEVVIYIINIIVLFVILRLLLYKPVHGYMAARTQRISSQLEDASNRQAEAMKTKERYESLMAGSEKEADEKLAEIIRKAHADAENIIEKANEKANEIVNDATVQATAEKKRILNGMRGEITDLSLDIARKILSREVNESDNRKIIDSFFDGRE